MKYLMTFALTVALAACGSKKDKEAPPATPPATGSGSAMMGSGSATAMGSGSGSAMGSGSAAVDVPTEEDFEAQAKSNITDKNVDTQVKKIEEELGSGQ